MQNSLDSIGNASAEAIARRMLQRASNQLDIFYACEDEDQQFQWIGKTEQIMQFCQGAEEGSVKAQALLLYAVSEVWDKLPFSFREKHQGSFWIYAVRLTGKEQKTLENHIRAVKAFFVDKIEPSGEVKVSSPKPENKPEETKEEYTAVPWNPLNVPIAKLVSITARAKAGGMTPELWSAAADPKVSWDQLQLQLNKGGGGGGTTYQINYVLSGPYLLAREGNEEAFIADVSLPHDTGYDSPIAYSLRERALKRLLLLISAKIEDDPDAALERNGLELLKTTDDEEEESVDIET